MDEASSCNERLYESNVLFSNGESVVPFVDDIQWKATNQATIGGQGLATGEADGVSTISGTFAELTETSELTIGVGLKLVRLEVSPVGATVALGSEIPYTALGIDQNGGAFPLTGLVWNASGDASIDIRGVATGTGVVPGTLEGTATIIASLGTVSKSVNLRIIAEPGDIVSITTTPAPLDLILVTTPTTDCSMK